MPDFLDICLWAALLLVALGIALAVIQMIRASAVARTKEQLRLAREEAELAVRTRTTFLASISHDLRTPLGNVLLMTTLLERELGGNLNARQHDVVSKIAQHCRHLLDVVNDLIDLSKIEAARLELQLETVELLPLIDSAFRLVYDLAAHKGLAVEEPDGSFDVYVRADELRIKQVLVNLLVNAIKYTPKEGRIGVGVNASQPGEVAITVWDTGIGIEGEAQKDIFEPFFQVNPRQGDDSAMPMGTGLGLALVKRIVEQHGGRVEVSSKPNLGSAFTFYLAGAPKPNHSARRRRTSSSGAFPPVGSVT